METAIACDVIDDMHSASKERREPRFPLQWLSAQDCKFFETNRLRVVVSLKSLQVNALLGEIKVRHLITYALGKINCAWVAFHDCLIAANFLKPFPGPRVYAQLL